PPSPPPLPAALPTSQPALTAARIPRRSSSASATTAPAPPWTMIEGTRRPCARATSDGVMAITVAQFGRLAKPDAAGAAQRADRTLPPLRAPRRPPRGGGRPAAASVRRPALLGPA